MRRVSNWAAAVRPNLLTAAALALPLIGCAPRAEISLRQPHAPPSQRDLKLASEWAYRTVEGGRQTCLVALPLPRAQAGIRAWVLYISAPDGLGTMTVARDAAGTETGSDSAGTEPGTDVVGTETGRYGVRGFLIQEVGELAGRTDVVAGTARFGDVWLAPQWRLVELNLRCEDGTEIRGRTIVRNSTSRYDGVASEVHAFERQYAADIRSLTAPQTQPVTGTPTGRRSASSP